jgi:hypothetical protein
MEHQNRRYLIFLMIHLRKRKLKNILDIDKSNKEIIVKVVFSWCIWRSVWLFKEELRIKSKIEEIFTHRTFARDIQRRALLYVWTRSLGLTSVQNAGALRNQCSKDIHITHLMCLQTGKESVYRIQQDRRPFIFVSEDEGRSFEKQWS